MSENALDDLDFLIEGSDLEDPFKPIIEPLKPPTPILTEEEEEEKEEIIIPIKSDLIEEEEEEEETTNQIKAVGVYFSKIGLLNVPEDEAEKLDWDEDTFIEKAKETWEQNSKAHLETYLTEKLGPTGTEFFQKVLQDGMPYTDFLRSFQRQESIENLDPIKHSDKIVRTYLLATGMDEEDVEDQIKYFQDNEILESKAEKFQTKLVQLEKSQRDSEAQRIKALKEDAERKELERKESYDTFLKQSLKIGELNGLPIKQKDANELLAFVTEKPHIVPQTGQKFTDFEYQLAKMKHEDPSKFLTIARLVMTDVDLSQVVKQTKTRQTNGLVEQLKSQKKPVSPKQYDDLNFLLNTKK